MAEPIRVVTDNMIGLKLPDFARLSPLVATVLGHNPGPFTGPGTNTYIVGMGKRPLLLDTGIGVPKWAENLPRGLQELSNTDQFDKIVLTHAHQDHIGGVKDEALDAMILKGRGLVNEDERLKQYLDIQRYIAAQMYSVAGNPNGLTYMMIGQRVRNFLPSGDVQNLVGGTAPYLWLKK